MKTFLATIAMTSFVVACSAEKPTSGTSTAIAVAPKVMPGSFSLVAGNYDPICFTAAFLQISKDKKGNTAVLENATGGICELYTAPNKRKYQLLAETISCGSVKLTGTRQNGDKISIVDHRPRQCLDKPANAIEVTETFADGYVVKYSQNPETSGDLAPEIRSFRGTFESIAAIGGETTGTWLTNGEKSIELDMKTNGLEDEFKPGDRAQVTGFYKQVTGVEILVRTVFEVQSVVNFDDMIGAPVCMAYWSGWEFDTASQSCKKRGRSGCSNPFEFTTQDECEAAHQ